MIINFVDNGQDFTTWTLNEQGVVVDCRPFQAWLWNGTVVLNHRDLKPGMLVQVQNQTGPTTLRHRVESVVQQFESEGFTKECRDKHMAKGSVMGKAETVEVEFSLKWIEKNPILFVRKYEQFFKDHENDFLITSKVRPGFLTLYGTRRK
ncbi:hypothetical protein BcepF1.057 [Burkholderia phage BcepF1]|uniref:Uncharacterized protein n=1 Tax=Burkholderia phage BcepF1 TaxID=2886897 RepID=A1YZW1_9CAUD|nr:hypothetical protein BcepF1.057 [Burkholderia phage BcepF1]ABL96788.1 hypothetical protein BcepF1.057 [Burkholderia phage BcepF1]